MVNQHDKALRYLCLHPQEMGIENVILRAEKTIWTPEGGGTVTLETDIIFYTAYFYELPYHLIEYKGVVNERQKAVEQLYKGRRLIQQLFKTDAYLYFVFKKNGKYHVEPYGRNRRKR